MTDITRENLVAMGVIDPNAREFNADEVRKQVESRDTAAQKALENYRREKGLIKK